MSNNNAKIKKTTEAMLGRVSVTDQLKKVKLKSSQVNQNI